MKVHGKVGQEEFVRSRGGGQDFPRSTKEALLSIGRDLAWVKQPHLDVINFD